MWHCVGPFGALQVFTAAGSIYLPPKVLNVNLNSILQTRNYSKSCDCKVKCCLLLNADVVGDGGWSVAMADHDALPVFIVDAFTSAPFSGNPAAVCLVTTTHVSITYSANLSLLCPCP